MILAMIIRSEYLRELLEVILVCRLNARSSEQLPCLV